MFKMTELEQDSGYVCPACQEPINEDDVIFSEGKEPYHRNCLIV